MLQSFTLNNGLKVVTYSQPSLNAIYINLSVRAGTLYEDETNSKIGHLTEHLLHHGIPALPTANLYNKFFDESASYRIMSTDIDKISLDLDCPKESLEVFLKVVAQTFFEPLLPESSIEQEKKSVVNENDKRLRGDPEFFKARYTDPAYFLRLLMAKVDEIYYDRVTHADIVKYWSTFFIPNNAFLVIVGDLSNVDIKTLLEQNFGKYNSNQASPKFPEFSKDMLTDKNVKLVSDKNITCYVDLTFPGAPLNIDLKEMITARLIRRILFGNFHSVMRSRLSTDSGYSYNIYSDPIYLPNFGLALIYTHCRPNNLKGLVETLLTTLQEFKTLGPSEEELELAKKTHVRRSLIDDDHPTKLRERLRDELMYYKPVTIEEYSNLVNQITRETVIEFLKKYWDFSKALLYIRGPFDQIKFLSDINEGNLMQLLNNLN